MTRRCGWYSSKRSEKDENGWMMKGRRECFRKKADDEGGRLDTFISNPPLIQCPSQVDPLIHSLSLRCFSSSSSFLFPLSVREQWRDLAYIQYWLWFAEKGCRQDAIGGGGTLAVRLEGQAGDDSHEIQSRCEGSGCIYFWEVEWWTWDGRPNVLTGWDLQILLWYSPIHKYHHYMKTQNSKPDIRLLFPHYCTACHRTIWCLNFRDHFAACLGNAILFSLVPTSLFPQSQRFTIFSQICSLLA